MTGHYHESNLQSSDASIPHKSALLIPQSLSLVKPQSSGLANILADIRDNRASRNIHSARVAVGSQNVVRQQASFLRIRLLGVLGEVEPQQIVVQVLGRHTPKLLYKLLQAPVVGVYMLDAISSPLRANRTNLNVGKTAFKSNPLVGFLAIYAKRRTLCNIGSNDSLDAVGRTLAHLCNLGHTLTAPVHGAGYAYLFIRKSALAPLVEDGAATLAGLAPLHLAALAGHSEIRLIGFHKPGERHLLKNVVQAVANLVPPQESRVAMNTNDFRCLADCEAMQEAGNELTPLGDRLLGLEQNTTSSGRERLSAMLTLVTLLAPCSLASL